MLGKEYKRDSTWDLLLKTTKGIDDDTIQQIKWDIQLYILQSLDDEWKNCLHFSCKSANKTIYDLIVRMSKDLSDVYN